MSRLLSSSSLHESLVGFRPHVVAAAALVLVTVTAAALAEEPPAGSRPLDEQPGLVSSEFIYETAPFPSCHASTIVESGGRLLVAWFGGTEERHPDVGIWTSHREDDGWSTPVEVANGVESPTVRYPTWNPVLFQPRQGPLMLFFKVGPKPNAWWGMLQTSEKRRL